MYTQCPHCKSRYRIGSDTVDAFGGFVRCGNCNYKFNIHDQVPLDSEEEKLLNTATRPVKNKETGSTKKTQRIEPRLERDEEQEELNIRFGADDSHASAPESNDNKEEEALEPQHIEPQLGLPDDSEGVSAADDPAIDRFTFTDSMDSLDISSDSVEQDDSLDALADKILDESSDISPDGDGSLQDSEQDSEQDSVQDLELKLELDQDSAQDFDQDSGPSLDPEKIQDTELENDPFDSFVFASLDDYGKEKQDSSDISLLAEDGDDLEQRGGFFWAFFSFIWRLLVFLFWLAAAGALGYLLYTQIKDTYYPAYRNHDLVQEMRTVACKYISCDEVIYDPETYEIVLSRMDEVEGPGRQLHVSIFILNRAPVPQPYPNIQLTLKTIDGSTAGRRVIHPKEYFTSEDSLIKSSSANEEGADSSEPLIKADKLGKILIKLDRPPADAVGFESRVVQ